MSAGSLNTATDSLAVQTQKTSGGATIGQSTSDLVGFYGTAGIAQPAVPTTALTTLTIADAAGTPDYSIAAVTNSSPFGFSNAAEAITLLYVIKNLQVRVGELQTKLEALGLIA